MILTILDSFVIRQRLKSLISLNSYLSTTFILHPDEAFGFKSKYDENIYAPL